MSASRNNGLLHFINRILGQFAFMCDQSGRVVCVTMFISDDTEDGIRCKLVHAHQGLI